MIMIIGYVTRDRRFIN